MLWNKEHCSEPALNIICDVYAEELSFPLKTVLVGSSTQICVLPHSTSEIRRSDRRDVTPEQIFYMAMKIMRLRDVEGIYIYIYI